MASEKGACLSPKRSVSSQCSQNAISPLRALQGKQRVSLETATANWSPLADLWLLQEVILAYNGSPFPVITTRQMAFKLHPKKLTGHLSF